MSKLCLRVPNFPGKDKLMAKGAVVAAKVSQKSPEICVGAAIVCGIGGTILACRATLKVEGVLNAYNDRAEKIHEGEELQKAGKTDPEHQYLPEDIQRDKFFNMVHCGIDILRLYAPSILLGAMSITLVVSSYRIMAKRQATLLFAYESLQKAYDTYRQRVRDEFGEEKELDIYNGVTEKTIKDEDGKKKKVHELAGPCSMYTRCFDESNRMWKKDAEMNKFFLVCQQAHANDLLKIRGHLFLNEVLDMLCLPRSPMGQDVGWMLNGGGDGFVSFGIWDATKEAKREFINGYERCIWLDFNCDGYIKDKI